MNTDLSDVLAPVTQAVEYSAPTITLDEIAGRRSVQPPFPDPASTPVALDQHRRPKRTYGFVVGAAIAAAVVVGLVVVTTRPASPTVTTPADSSLQPDATTAVTAATVSDPTITATPSPSVTPQVPTDEIVTVPFTGSEVVPTLLEPLVLPVGVQFVQGGTVQMGTSPSVDMWTPDLVQWFSIAWSPQSLCGQTSATSPLGPLPQSVEIAISQMESTSDDGVPGGRQLRWCDGTVLVSIDGREVGNDDIAALARTVTTGTDGEYGTFVAPVGFRHRLALLNGKLSALAYANGETTLRVLSFPATDGEFEVLQRGMRDTAGMGTHSIEPFEIGGRPALWRFDSQLAVQYDEKTIAYIDGVGLTDQDLLNVAASLVPADPALAPPLTGSCEVLSICG